MKYLPPARHAFPFILASTSSSSSSQLRILSRQKQSSQLTKTPLRHKITSVVFILLLILHLPQNSLGIPGAVVVGKFSSHLLTAKKILRVTKTMTSGDKDSTLKETQAAAKRE